MITDRNTLKIEVETEGIEEATEKIEALADAYDCFPAQVQIRGCRNCTFHIHPSQTKIIEMDREEDCEEPNPWEAMVPPAPGTIYTNPNGAVIMDYLTYLQATNAKAAEEKKAETDCGWGKPEA